MQKSPFKFLDSYVKEDKDIFFGRENEVEEIYHKIFSGRTLLVYGVSGTGKSSIIQCGLANRFEDSDWLPVSIRRGNDINSSFEKALSKIAVVSVEDLFQNKENGMAKAVQSVYLDHFKPIYFIFDQFEELFIFGSKDEKYEFIKTVKSIIKSNIQAKFIFVIREEYLAGITEFENEIHSIMENRIRIEKMSPKNAAVAIEGSCKSVGIAVEEGFSEALLENLKASSGNIELTYLQVYLDRIYQKAVSEHSGMITLGGSLLEGIGNVADILGQFLDEQIKKLPDPESGTAVLKSFVSLNGTKKQVTKDEVYDSVKSFGKELKPEQILEILRKFTSFRILKDKDESGKYELRHDALAAKIFEKITMLEKELLEVRQYIENAYSTYRRNGLLLSKESLKYVGLYLDNLYLDQERSNFIKISKDEIESAEKRSKRIAYSVMSIIIVLLSIFTLWALVERRRTEDQLKITEIEKQKNRALYYNSLSKEILNTNSDHTKALAIAEYALSQDSSNNEIFQNILDVYYNYPLYEILFRTENFVSVSQLSSDGEVILTGSVNGMVILYDMKGNIISKFRAHKKPIACVSFSSDGKSVLTSAPDSTACLWDTSGKLITKFTGHKDIGVVAVFSPDGKNILTGSTDNSARLWSLDGNIITEFKGHKNHINSVAFFPDGNSVLTGSKDSTAILWGMNGRILQKFTGHRGGITAVAVSPDCKKILTSSTDQTVRVWELNGRMSAELKREDTKARRVMFTPDSKNILTCSVLKNVIRLWDLDGNLVKEYNAEYKYIMDFLLTKNGREIISIQNHNVIKWDIGTDYALKFKTENNFKRSAFSPEGNRILAGYFGSGIVELIDFEGNKLGKFNTGSDDINSLKFSPDGQNVLITQNDSATVWDVNGKLLRTFKGHKGIMNDAVFSNDRKMIMTCSSDSSAVIWDFDGNQIKKIKLGFGIIGADFTSDNRNVILTGGRGNGNVKLFDLNGSHILDYNGMVGVSMGVKAASDNRIIAGSAIGELIVWDVSGRMLFHNNGFSQVGVASLSFTPDGKFSSIAFRDGKVEIYDLNYKRVGLFNIPSADFTFSVSTDGSKAFTGVLAGGTIYKLKSIYKNNRRYENISVADQLKYGIYDHNSILNSGKGEILLNGIQYYYTEYSRNRSSEFKSNEYRSILKKFAEKYISLSKRPDYKFYVVHWDDRYIKDLATVAYMLYEVNLFEEGLKFAELGAKIEPENGDYIEWQVMGNILTDNWIQAKKLIDEKKDKTYYFYDEFGNINDYLIKEGIAFRIEYLKSRGINHQKFAEVMEMLKEGAE